MEFCACNGDPARNGRACRIVNIHDRHQYQRIEVFPHRGRHAVNPEGFGVDHRQIIAIAAQEFVRAFVQRPRSAGADHQHYGQVLIRRLERAMEVFARIHRNGIRPHAFQQVTDGRSVHRSVIRPTAHNIND